ncbi:MAG: hypothetical protein ABIX28_14310 [Vicinamibacterales bacterium]
MIDVHVHSTTTDPGDVDRLRARDVRYWFLAGLTSDLRDWAGADASRFVAALVFPCDRRRAPITGRACYDAATDFPDIPWLRAELRAGRINGFGELSLHYLGLSIADASLDPYWDLAEEFDLPVGVHLGPGPKGAAYEFSGAPFKSPAFRMSFGDPLVLEVYCYATTVSGSLSCTPDGRTSKA